MKPTFLEQADIVQVKELYERDGLWVVRVQSLISGIYAPEWTCKTHELFVGAKCQVGIKLIPIMG
jgi:hypothetical protein